MTNLGVRMFLGAALAAAIVTGPRADAAQVPTTVDDFFLPGTQPESITDTVFSSNACLFCHGGYGAEAIHDHWKASAMAQAARDPLFHACLTVANQDAAFAGDLCLRCHTPAGWLEGRSEPTDGSMLIDTDFDGVSCSICHRLVDPVFDAENPAEDVDILDALDMDPDTSVPTSVHSGTYVFDPLDRRRGPFNLDADLAAEGLPPFFLHEWRQSPYHRESLMCGTCHDVSNPAFERVGGPVPAPTDTYVLGALDTPNPSQDKYEMFPVERTFSEWANSAFALAPIDMEGRYGGNDTFVSTCQDCHMPTTTGFGCGIDGSRVERDDMPLHDFLGAANWMLDAVLDLDVSGEIYPVSAASGLTQPEVDAAKARNAAFMQAASDVELTFDPASLNVRVVNQTGHKLPTGYPEGRRMWVNVQFKDGTDTIVDEYGAYDDMTATLTLDTKVYELKAGVDAAVSAATGVPEGESFHFAINNVVIKDNRIPPRGFTNATFEAVQAHPVDYSYADGQYWDDTQFDIPCDAVAVDVNTYYQTSSREYIEFLQLANVTDNNGDILYDLWLDNGMSPPVEMDAVSLVLGDCNNNGQFDGCDIENMIELDDNMNNIPDSCEVPAINALGGRYIAITPQDLGPPVPFALVLTSPDYPCWEKYLAANGDLADTPALQTADQWGTVVVASPDIVPTREYRVELEYEGGLRAGLASATTWVWGDANDNGSANFADVQLVVFGFQNNFDNAALEAVDLFPCDPNGIVNFEDIQQAVGAFQGQLYDNNDCTQPCE